MFTQDKVTLYRYKPVAKRTLRVPVLVAYGQVGRYTMTDLQEDRSMLRNLLALGVDVYAVDWGSPTRSDRWLTFEDRLRQRRKEVTRACTTCTVSPAQDRSSESATQERKAG